MKTLYRLLSWIIKIIALLVFASGLSLTVLGGVDFAHAISHFTQQKDMIGLVSAGLLQSVDIFLIAIVFFVFAIGILILFETKSETASPLQLPPWLRIKNFTQLKVILWEAILTTLVVSFLDGLVQRRLNGEDLGPHLLIIPASILLIAISLFFLKKGSEHDH
jgi:uncharacterized membrane protein YqhA